MVTRCVCFGRRFSELKAIAQKHKIRTLEDLQKIVQFGENCQRCHPYIRKMLESGETIFEVIPVEQNREK